MQVSLRKIQRGLASLAILPLALIGLGVLSTPAYATSYCEATDGNTTYCHIETSRCHMARPTDLGGDR